MTGARLVIDTSRCIACRACQVACKQWHSLPSEDTAFTGTYQNPPDMSGANLTVAKFKEIETGNIYRPIKWLFFKDQCRHCDSAFCKGACTRGAIIKTVGGFVRINHDPAEGPYCDPNLCSTAEVKLCQNVCPFNVPKYKYVKGGSQVEAKMMKCDLCYNRLKDPLLRGDNDPILPYNVKYDGSNKPSCMVTCPPNAIRFGLADSMWTGAVNRVKQLRAQGVPATIYPKQTGPWGPTRVIWVLTEPSSVYGLPGYGY